MWQLDWVIAVFTEESVVVSFKVLNFRKRGYIAMERNTVGKLSTDLLQKDIYSDHSVGEQMQEQLSDYESNVLECVARGKDFYPGDFYLIVITKREKLMQNVLRHYFFHRLSCPTPDYDQALYKYNRKDESLEFMWVIPAKEVCFEMRDRRLEIGLEQRELLQFVLDFIDGTLDKKSRILNGEPLINISPVVQ